MARLADRYRCLCFDNRGYGRSDKPLPQLAYGIARHARDLRAVLEHAGLAGERPVLVGHSFGGSTALEYYWTHPDQVRALVLVGSFAAGKQLLQAAGEFDLVGFIKGSIVKKQQRFEFFTGSGATDEVALEATKFPLYALLGNLESCLAFDGEARLGEVRVPTLVIHGDHDIVAPLEPCGTALRDRIPGARLEVVPTNHCPMLEDPERFAILVGEFAATR
jgi:pimeloyl-ACP methyl ester carboxylesterase